MTKLFEDFIDHVGESLEKDCGLPSKTSWRILKGYTDQSTGELVGVAVSMARKLVDSISLAECIEIVQRVTGKQKSISLKIVRRMVTDGLLVEDSVFEGGQWQSVIRLSYQRFSDHLICRHLLEAYLDVRSEGAIRRSFFLNRPLGKIFQLDQFLTRYRHPGLASALMLEFPERVKRVLPEGERELVFYLPRPRRLLEPLVDVFLEGLLWRDRQSFSAQTSRIIGVLLDHGSRQTKYDTFEVLVSLASRPGHPISAERLVVKLSQLTLAERDLIWSEFLRTAAPTSAVHRLMDWVEDYGGKPISAEVCRALVRLCSTFLTTTHRPLRDRATRMLVLLGEQQPAELFNVALQSLNFKDPYVPERLLAASYGITMRNWAVGNQAFASALMNFARSLYVAMFSAKASHSTKHVLARDYALGTIELCKRVDRSALRRVPAGHLRPPFVGASPFPNANLIKEESCKDAESALGMDFRNYTIGRLIDDRANYDDRHPGYRDVLKQIKWRILNLGYNLADFREVDAEIGRQNVYREQREKAFKIDRYGKKYAWIAFFEACGLREDKGLPAQRHDDVRVSDCDIDPSFPASPIQWQIHFQQTGSELSDREWLEHGPIPSHEHLLSVEEVGNSKGPWVLLQGYVSERLPQGREIFSFLRGLFVNPTDIPKLRARLAEIEYPGNFAIPDAGSDHYTYAGEIPWSKKYARPLRTKSGVARPAIGEALELRSFVKRRKRFDRLKPWELLTFYRGLENDDSKTLRGSAYVEVTVNQRTPGYEVEIPYYGFAWESYHSHENQIGSVDFVAPAVCDFLKLRNRGSALDLYDDAGRIASLFRVYGEFPESRATLLYLREDLLKQYLQHRQQEIVWIVWGERAFQYPKTEKLRDRGDVQEVWASHKHIHKTFVSDGLD